MSDAQLGSEAITVYHVGDVSEACLAPYPNYTHTKVRTTFPYIFHW